MLSPARCLFLNMSRNHAFRGLSNAPSACGGGFETSRSEWNYRQHVPAGAALAPHPRFLLLVDEACSGDCELLVYIFAATSRAVIAGVNTSGVIQFRQPGDFLLPHSR